MAQATSPTTPTGGTVHIAKLLLRRTAVISNVLWGVATAGGTATAGQNEIGLYNSTGSRIAATNVDSVIAATGLKTTAVGPVKVEAGFVWAAFVFNVSSGAGRRAYFSWSAYCAGKAAVDRLSECLALEEKRAGTRVLSVAPGIIDTGMQAQIRASTAEQFPEICVAEKKLYEVLLGATVERRSHILGGCTACEYHMRFDTAAGAESGAVVQLRPREAQPGANA